ncbi:MAG: Ig-like domain-containing protein, partial [Pseudomonadota bacterium]
LFDPSVDGDETDGLTIPPVENNPLPAPPATPNSPNDTFDEGNLAPSIVPEAADIQLTGMEDAAGADAITGVFSQVSGVTIAVVNAPANGTVQVGTDGTFVYLPDQDFFGTDTFTYSITSPSGQTSTGTVTIDVTPVNDQPVAQNEVVTLEEDGSALGQVSASDVDGDALSYNIVEGSDTGTLALLPDGTYSYVPNADFAGRDSFVVEVSDGEGGSDTAVLTFIVTQVPDAPEVEETDLEAAFGGVLIADLSDLTVDPDGESDLTFEILSAPEVGETTLDGSVLTYDAAEDVEPLAEGEALTVNIVIGVSDETGLMSEATLQVTLNGTNEPPTLDAVTLTADENGPVSVDLGELASDPDNGATLSFALESVPDGLGVTLEDGILRFDPGTDFDQLEEGEVETFEVLVRYSDEFGAGGTASVLVEVTGTNDLPVVLLDASDVEGTVVEAGQTTDGIPTVTGQLSATDAEGSIVWTGSATGAAGTFTILVSGAWSYQIDQEAASLLAEGETLVETFVATATDDSGGAVDQSVTITVNGSNDGPLEAEVNITTGADTSVTGSAQTTDPDNGDTLTYFAGEVAPENGTVVVEADGSFEYTPVLGFFGEDSFDVIAVDTSGASATVTVRVGVERADISLPSGQAISLVLNVAPSEAAPAGSVQLSLSPFAGEDVSLAIAMDSSGSIGLADWNVQKAQVIGALELLASRFEGASNTVDVQIINYSNTSQPTEVFDLVQDLDTLRATVDALPFLASTTNWEAALEDAADFFDGQGHDSTNILFFITD